MKKSSLVKEKLHREFELVGIISYKTYQNYCEEFGIKCPDLTCESLIVCGKIYSKYEAKDSVKLANYCYNGDYHERLRDCFDRCETEYSGEDFYVDIDIVNEKVCGYLAGFGFIGKNQLLTNPKYGSYFNIGVLRVTDEFDVYDKVKDYLPCKNCQKCTASCPSKALDGGFDEKKCQSYLTQYGKFAPFNYMQSSFLVGCDLCMDSCPYNVSVMTKFLEEHSIYEKLTLEYLINVSNRQFKKDFRGTPIYFIHPDQLLKNLILLKMQKNEWEELKMYEAYIFNSPSKILKSIAHFFSSKGENTR